jgi:hypothetical protein
MSPEKVKVNIALLNIELSEQRLKYEKALQDHADTSLKIEYRMKLIEVINKIHGLKAIYQEQRNNQIEIDRLKLELAIEVENYKTLLTQNPKFYEKKRISNQIRNIEERIKSLEKKNAGYK